MTDNALGGLFGGAAAGLNLAGSATTTAPDTTAQNDDQTVHNVIIVGSGPSGYTAAIYTARANLKPVLFASSISPGGDLMTTTEVENFPGFINGIQGPELMTNIGVQAERFGADIRYEDVAEVELEGDVKKVILTDGSVHLAKTVIISTGSEYRKLGVDGESRLSGHGVSWCATCDGFFFKEKALAVIGGGDSALEEALFLTAFASKVYLVHRRDSFRASEIMAQRALAHEKIEVIWDSVVKTIDGDEKVSGLTLSNVKTGEETTLDVEGVFVAIGSDPRTSLVQGLSLIHI